MTIRCIMFDMGRVLVDFSHDQMFEAMGEVCGASGQQIREWLWDSGLQGRFERGEIDSGAVRDELQGRAGREIDETELMRAASDIFTLNEPLLEVIDRLKHAGYRLVVLSNTCPPHVEWIGRHWDVLERFDALVFSYEVGAMKPSPQIYRAAIDVAGCEAGECFFVDDLPENVEAARALGLSGAVYVGVESLQEALAGAGVAAACESD
jgi:HAD superfamily hydrolase (TIGR01509 family)